jgi:hypothetical protein
MKDLWLSGRRRLFSPLFGLGHGNTDNRFLVFFHEVYHCGDVLSFVFLDKGIQLGQELLWVERGLRRGVRSTLDSCTIRIDGGQPLTRDVLLKGGWATTNI